MQELRFQRQKRRNLCLRKAFIEDIINFLIESIHNRFSIILSLYSNEDIILGRLFKCFKSIGLIETFKSIHDESPPVSFIEESKQLDIVWVSPSLQLKLVSITPFLFGIGDYRVIILDFNVELILRLGFIPIYPVNIRRLTMN